MSSSLLISRLVPFTGYFFLLVLATSGGDYLLHHFDLVWVGRYLGIPGTVLIVLSLLYSLRKRKTITTGNPKVYLMLHEVCAWVGSLMVFVHAGVHFNAILPWLALIAMGVNVISGMIGRYLLDSSRRQLQDTKERQRNRGLSKDEAEMALFWDSVTFDAMARWRAVHFPIAYLFAVLSIGHIVSIFLFWEWK